MSRPAYEPVIGLEIHAQLLTATKIFCGCSTAFGAPPNTHVCPVCLGLPGALPVLNRRAVELAIKAALALGCTIQPRSIFARKNYFYPDLPKGYQISQYERPLATTGSCSCQRRRSRRAWASRASTWKRTPASRCITARPDSDHVTSLDFNRSGVPLIEIVTEPDLRSAADAAECFSRLREILVALGANDGNMEEGSLRCDANVSIRPVGQATLGTKAEVKNVNSFRYLQKALEFEIERQIEVVSPGGRVRQETRLWDSDTARRRRCAARKRRTTTGTFPSPICRRSKSRPHGSPRFGRTSRSFRRRASAASWRRTVSGEYDADLLVRLLVRRRRLLRGHGRCRGARQGSEQLDSGRDAPQAQGPRPGRHGGRSRCQRRGSPSSLC